MNARLLCRSGWLLASACVLLAQSGLAQPSKEVHRTLPLAANGLVSIETHKGSVRVSAWDRNEVQVDVRIAEDGVFAQNISRANVDIAAGAGSVTLKSKWDWAGSFFGIAGSAPLFHYTLRVPRQARLRLKDHKSDIVIEGLAGDLDVNTYKGTARLRDLEGALTLNTYKGEVRANFTRFDGRTTVDTYKGAVTLELPRDSRFTLRQSLDRKVSLRSDFPVTVRTSRGSSLSTTAVNGGGPELALRSHKGSLQLRSRL